MAAAADWLLLDDWPVLQVAVEHHRDHDDHEEDPDAKKLAQVFVARGLGGLVVSSPRVGLGVWGVGPVFTHFTSLQRIVAIIAAMKAKTSMAAQAQGLGLRRCWRRGQATLGCGLLPGEATTRNDSEDETG